MGFFEGLGSLWEAWMLFENWIPFWDPWGAVTAGLFLLYFFGRLARTSI